MVSSNILSLDNEKSPKKDIAVQITIGLPSLPPEGSFFNVPDSQGTIPFELTLHSLHEKAKAQAKEIVNLPDTPLIVAIYLGGKGRLIGKYFIEDVVRCISDRLQIQGFSLDQIQAKLAKITELSRDKALNVSSSLFQDLQGIRLIGRDETTPEDAEEIDRYIRESDEAPMVAIRTATEKLLTNLHYQAGSDNVRFLIIDDQRISGTTATFGERLIIQSEAQVRRTHPDIAHQTQVVSLTDLAVNWEMRASRSVNHLVESNITMRDLFEAYTGSPLSEDEALTLQSAGKPQKRGSLPAPPLRAVDVRNFRSFWIRIQGKVANYILRGGYSGHSPSGETLPYQAPLPNHELHFRGEFEKGPIEVTVNAAQAVAAYNTEIAAVFTPVI